MTAVPTARELARAEPPRWPKISWTMMSVIFGALMTAAGGISAYATLTDRVAHIEQELPPGAISRLDERTVQIQKALERLESRP